MTIAFDSHHVKATRKEFQCHGCLDTIPVGSRVEKSAGTSCGDFWTCILCAACSDWIAAHRDFWEAYPDGFMLGDVGDCRRVREP